MSNDSNSDSLFETLKAVAEISLVLLGLVGISVQIFRDQGWFQQLINKVLYSPAGLFSIPFIVLIIYILNRWMTMPTDGVTTTKGNLPLYLMMAIGAYFLFRLIYSGSF